MRSFVNDFIDIDFIKIVTRLVEKQLTRIIIAHWRFWRYFVTSLLTPFLLTSFSYPVVEVGSIKVSEKSLRRFNANFTLLVWPVDRLTRLTVDDLHLKLIWWRHFWRPHCQPVHVPNCGKVLKIRLIESCVCSAYF